MNNKIQFRNCSLVYTFLYLFYSVYLYYALTNFFDFYFIAL